jgi:hypothetical protein
LALSNKEKMKYLFFIVLSIFTLYPIFFIDRYLDTGIEMIENNSFKQDIAQWQTNDKSNAFSTSELLCLSSSSFAKIIFARQDIDFLKTNMVLRLKTTFKCNDVVPGKRAWNKARVLLVQLQGGKEKWDIPHCIASLTGTKEWKEYSKVFFLDKDTDSLKVEIQLNHCKGALSIKNLSLKPVQEASWYLWMQRTIFLLWGLLIAYIVYFYMKAKTVLLYKIIFVFSFVSIIAGTLMSGDIKYKTFDAADNKIHNINNKIEIKTPPISSVSRTIHFIFFATFAISLLTLNPKILIYFIVLDIIVIAGATEILQCYIDGRGPSIIDFCIDILGSITGMLFFYIWNKRIKHRC